MKRKGGDRNDNESLSSTKIKVSKNKKDLKKKDLKKADYSKSTKKHQKPVEKVAVDDEMSASESESESEVLSDLYSKKMRYRLQELNNEVDDADNMDDDESDGSNDIGDASVDEDDDDASEVSLNDEEKRWSNKLADLIPNRGDKDGKFGYRCRYCTAKVLHSESDIVNHLKSSRHVKLWRRYQRANRSEEQIKAIKTKNAEKAKLNKEKLEARIKLKIEKKKEKRKAKIATLTPEQIAKRKEKFQRKQERRMERKAAEGK